MGKSETCGRRESGIGGMKTTRHELDVDWFSGCELRINKGNVLAVYTDEGPGGVCGQSMRITSPHTTIFWFPDEEIFREWYVLANKTRNGKKPQIRWVVVGDYCVPGPISLVKVERDATN